MTKRREPLTYHRALTSAAATIGWEAVAALCGVSPRTVRNWSDPDTDAEIRLIDAERIDRACLDSGATVAPFHHCFTVRLEIASRDGVGDLISVAGRAAKESGEAVNALIEVAACNSAVTRHAALKEAEEAIAALADGVAAIARHNREG